MAGLLEDCPKDTEQVVTVLKEKADIASSELAERSLPKFVQSKGCLPLIEQLIGADSSSAALATGMIYDPDLVYTGPVLAWLQSVAHFGLALNPMVSVTDMTLHNNPLIFINDAFCSKTGYSRDESLGRNCRFLQGPETEAQSVAVIKAALSELTDCVVKIINYRKTGEPFDMLLALRPIVDATGAARFCIGLHFEITPDKPLKTLVAKLGKLIKLVPAKAPL